MSAFAWVVMTALLGAIPCGGPSPRPEAAVPRSEGASPVAGGALRLSLNIPAFRLDASVDGYPVRSYPVAVGTRRYPTPTGSFLVDQVVWNPWWIPPESDWAKDEKPTPPGPANPVGKVKLRFRSLYFLHGTPFESSIGKAASHGCVRMTNRDAVDLARLVHRHTLPEVPGARLEALGGESRETVEVPLLDPVPLEIVYETVEVRDGWMEIHPDVYGKAGGGTRERAVQALLARGYAAADLDGARLDSLLARGRESHVRVPVDSLVARPPPGSADAMAGHPRRIP